MMKILSVLFAGRAGCRGDDMTKNPEREKIEKFLKKNKNNRVQCPAMNAIISKEQCNRNQNEARGKKSGNFGDKLNKYINNCLKCKEGKKHYKKLKSVKKPREKECRMHELFPDKCEGSGKIIENKNLPISAFHRSEYCCDRCKKLSNATFFKPYLKIVFMGGKRIA